MWFVIYNFNRLIENEGLLKVTGSNVHCSCGNIPEMAQYKDVATAVHYYTK